MREWNRRDAEARTQSIEDFQERPSRARPGPGDRNTFLAIQEVWERTPVREPYVNNPFNAA